ncbi:hypothetical protein KIF59_07475 [Enterobacter cloacae subsp. cloacae]|nr:hypothetical protein [Enterobacter cloacae subsp. cloacae]
MLQQANALDERESFSSLRRLARANGHFALRTTLTSRDIWRRLWRSICRLTI